MGFSPALGALSATIELADSIWDLPDDDDEGARPDSLVTGHINSNRTEARLTYRSLSVIQDRDSTTLHEERDVLVIAGLKVLHISEKGEMATQI